MSETGLYPAFVDTGLTVDGPDERRREMALLKTRAAHMALDMLAAMERLNENRSHPLQVRIGIATGSAMAGVVGKRKFLYDLWGSAVNAASRMESHGLPRRIQLTDSTRRLLNGDFAFEERGLIEVKGIGPMHTWFLNGRSGEDAHACATMQ